MKKTNSSNYILKSIASVGIAFAAVLVLNVLLYRYFAIPAMTASSSSFWWFIFWAWICFAIIFAISSIALDTFTKIHSRILFGITIGVAVLSIGFGFASGKMLNSAKYQQIIQVNSESSFESEFLDITENPDIPIAIVDLETARIMGNRTIGNITHSSWYEVDNEFNLIKYQGEYYRISPLNYGDIFKYDKAEASGLPGYVLVNAQTAEAQYCELEKPFFYSPSAYWGKDLARHLRNWYPSKIFENSYFEIDEEGAPFWITPVYQSTIGVWGGRVQTSVIVTDAISGQSTEYSIEEAPTWIDHNFSLEYLMDTVQYHYSFVDGYWNSIVSETGVYKLAYTYRSDKSSGGYFEGYTSVIGQDGDVYFYSGLTPANNSESNAGFVMMNCRTGKVIQYNYSSANAAEESSAQGAAESLVQNYGFQATFPIIINVGGEETYLMTLKDKAGLVQRYSFCNVNNYSIVVQNETLESALADYLAKLGQPTNVNDTDVEAQTKTKSSIIEAVYSAEIDGTTVFYYKFQNDKKLYKATIVVNELQVTFDIGDRITIEYIDSDAEILEIADIN